MKKTNGKKYDNFLEYKRTFIQAHSCADWYVDTSSMDQYGSYAKTYIFSDGAQLVEVNRPIWDTVELIGEVRGVKVKIRKDIQLFETEAWNTDDSSSVRFYEQY